MARKQRQVAAAVALLCTAGSASAGTVTGWNDRNVTTTIASPAGDGVSTIYDRVAGEAGAVTAGRMVFDGVEAVSPGMKIVNNAVPSVPPTGGNVDNCLMASSTASCNSERQSGKRFKLDQTGAGSIDLILDHNPAGTGLNPGNDGTYKVYQKYGNDTAGTLTSFSVTLGTGIGSGFVSSGAADGLRIVDFGAAPSNSQFSALFANGLFGPIDAEHPLTGYFSPQRSGFNLLLNGQDSFQSAGLFGAYGTLFGQWMSYSQAPTGYFFDQDGDATTDALLVAHQLTNGTWVQNRQVDAAGTVTTLAYGNDGTAFASLASLLASLPAGLVGCASALPGTPCLAGEGPVEDLAKFNLTFSMDPTGYAADEFTMRITAVPEPSTYAMMALGLLAIGAARRRRRG